MNDSNRDRTPAELKQIAARLREERATATPLEFDRLKLQALRQAERPRPNFYARQKGMFMKSRLALTMVIAAGFLLSTTGATLAITGSSGSGSAAQNQYTHVSPADGGGGNKNKSLGGGGNNEPAAVSEESAPASEQVAVANSSGGSLPFTGFVAIPLLIVGIGLFSVGAILRRKATGNHGADA